MSRINVREFEPLIWNRDWATDHNKAATERAWYNYMEAHGISDEQYWDVWYKMYQRMALEGNPYAMAQLGELEFLLKNNPQAGYGWLLRAANAGAAKAMRLLGDGYSKYSNDNSSYCHLGFNPKLCFEWTMKAAQMNDLDAIYTAALNFALGQDGFPENPNAEKYWLERGTSLGSAKCAILYADSHCNDPAKKLELYEKAMAFGDSSAYGRAALHLSRIFSGSENITRNFYNPKMAAKCFILSWFSDSGLDESDLDELHQIPYQFTEQEEKRWAAEAEQLIYRRE